MEIRECVIFLTFRFSPINTFGDVSMRSIYFFGTLWWLISIADFKHSTSRFKVKMHLSRRTTHIFRSSACMFCNYKIRARLFIQVSLFFISLNLLLEYKHFLVRWIGIWMKTLVISNSLGFQNDYHKNLLNFLLSLVLII